MSERTLDRETILDLTVNIIPLAIIAFFVVLFLVVRPWETNLYMTAVSMGLLVIPFAALVLLTYVSGSVIARDEAGGGGVATDGTIPSTDATLEGSNAETDEADADDYSMVEDQLDAEPEGSDDGGDSAESADETSD